MVGRFQEVGVNMANARGGNAAEDVNVGQRLTTMAAQCGFGGLHGLRLLQLQHPRPAERRPR